jgi:O-antigen ligase
MRLEVLFRPLLIISFIFFCLSILNPVHTRPWPSFFSELFAFIGIILLLPSLWYKKIILPRISIPFLCIAFIPLVQYGLGQIFFYSNAILSFSFLFYFWLALVIGFNLGADQNKLNGENCFNLHNFLAYFFVLCGSVSSIIVILQWLSLSQSSSFIMSYSGNRPYANMAQPNHLATFLYAGICSCWYLFEKYKIKKIQFFAMGFLLLSSIVLTQSRTAWLITVFVSAFLFYYVEKGSLRLSKKAIFYSIVYFVFASLVLPYLNSFLSHYFAINSIHTVYDRAMTGFGRLDIWNQMYHALIQSPWTGYGWNQTTAAQFNVIDTISGKEWATSAHNLFLDILVWCGVPLGLLIILFFVCFYFILFKNISNIEGAFSFIVISGFLIHACLEYPLYYSYFLLPLGLMCGTLIVDQTLKKIIINKFLIIITFVASLLGITFISKEYVEVSDNLFAGRLHAMGNLRSELELPHHLYFFDNFNTRAYWLALYPKVIVDQEQIQDSQYMVKSYLGPYDLHKSAQLLAINGYSEEATRQLRILQVMYGMNFSYQSLLDEQVYGVRD